MAKTTPVQLSKQDIENQELRDALDRAKYKLIQQNEALKQIAENALKLGVIVNQDTSSNSFVVATDGGQVVVPRPETNRFGELTLGSPVTLLPDTMQIVGKFTGKVGGVSAIVSRQVDCERCEVEITGAGKLIVKFPGGQPAPKVGDRVSLDASSQVIMENFGEQKPEYARVSSEHINWESIGGLETAKQELREAIIAPYENAELFAKFGRKPIKGVLLYGPPGCGKTLLGKAVANTVNENTEGGFLYVKGPEVLSSYVGESELKVRSLFVHAKKFKEKTGKQCVIFVDEADALLRKRDSGGRIGMETTIVPTFLSEWDGLEESSAVIILATNRPDTLDEAVLRDGRIDRRINVDRPDQATTQEIFMVHLQNKPLHADFSDGVQDAAKLGTELVFEHKSSLLESLSGALVANIIDRASSVAIQRAVKFNKVDGIKPIDLRYAVMAAAGEQRFIN